MESKNVFDINGDTIWIRHPDKSGAMVCATIRDDYAAEMQSVTWNISDGRYWSNAKLGGGLHRYIAAKWYGKEMLTEMTKRNFVVEHMDNDSSNCRIENLCFLHSDDNKAKGFTIDKQAKKCVIVWR